MSIASRNLFTIPISQTFFSSRKPQLRAPYIPSLELVPKSFSNLSTFHPRKSHFTNFGKAKYRYDYSDWAIQVKPLDLDGTTTPWGREDYTNSSEFNSDAFLSFLEIICLASSVAISIILAVNSGRRKLILPWFGENGLVWQCVFLVGGVFLGAIIRRRQWKRICEVRFLSRPVNLLERVEKVEEDLKSSSTMIRSMSRQLEKLGIRFRLTRKALKEPIAEVSMPCYIVLCFLLILVHKFVWRYDFI